MNTVRESNFLPGELTQPDQRFGFGPLHPNPRALGDRINSKKTKVVGRPRVLWTRIPQAHNHPHRHAS